MRDGFCECGCGEKTPISKQTDHRIGSIKGQPVRFLIGHNRRKYVAPLEGYIIDEKTGCWNWMLGQGRMGYGKSSINGKSNSAHINEWVRVHGPVPDGLELDHLCRNVKCVNPDHLEPVTPTENKRRSRATKLKPDDVSSIKASSKSNVDLAVEYGVTSSNISQIRRGFSWRDIE